jgi:hypothetical protein
MRRQIEKLRGHGKIYLGEALLCEASYLLTIHQDVMIASSMDAGESEIPGLKSTSMTVDPVGIPIQELFAQSCGKTLTLHLQDGDKQDFLLVTADGRIEGTGGIY